MEFESKGSFKLLKKLMYYVCVAIGIIVLVMASTTPSQAVVDKWVSQKYNIECEVDGSCTNGEGRIRLISSHFKNTGIYSSYEQRFEDPEGGETVIRTLGVFNQLIKMENSKLWDILN